MDRITIFDKNIPQIGLFSRNTPKGEEYAMVSEFIDYYCCKFLRDNRKNNLAVFIEPRIASGFPDVVFASFLPSIYLDYEVKESEDKIEIFLIL